MSPSPPAVRRCALLQMPPDEVSWTGARHARGQCATVDPCHGGLLKFYVSTSAEAHRSAALGRRVEAETTRAAAVRIAETIGPADTVLVRFDVQFDPKEAGGWSSARSIAFTAAELGVLPSLSPAHLALRERYREERDKRIRPEGSAQYRFATGSLAHLLDDPNAHEPSGREPLDSEVEVAIIGGGLGGLLLGARLRQAGVGDVRIIESGAAFGGAWYWNRYPGAQCDTESYIYLPLLEELGYVPTAKYALGPEILAHSQRIAKHFELHESALLQTRVTGLTWDDATSRWFVTTDRGDTLRARFVARATGPLNRPKLPGIPGIEDFTGHVFHTSRWDYAYTGGGPGGGLDGLRGKRVAIIGTGASAVQCVPFVAETAEVLYVAQRTPAAVAARQNQLTEPEWASSLRPGWQKQRMENFNDLLIGIPREEDLVDDEWTQLVGPAARSSRQMNDARVIEGAGFDTMETLRARVDQQVTDPEVAEQLKPYYHWFCKRLTFSNDYLQTFNRPNVHLLDTNGRGVERVTDDGLIVQGVHYEVDCIILATGFHVGGSPSLRAGFETRGRDGRTLTESQTRGMQSLHGVLCWNFPNCFFLQSGQAALPANFPHLLDEQATHVAYIIREALDREARQIEPMQEAGEIWARHITGHVHRRAAVQAQVTCTPSYYNNEGGAPSPESFAAGSIDSREYFQLLAEWREDGTFAGLDFLL